MVAATGKAKTLGERSLGYPDRERSRCISSSSLCPNSFHLVTRPQVLWFGGLNVWIDRNPNRRTTHFFARIVPFPARYGLFRYSTGAKVRCTCST